MSVTKSILSALVGVAIDRGLLRAPDSPVTGILPRAVFPSDADYSRFQAVTLKQVMAMSAIDAPDPPRKRDAEAVARYQKFWRAPSRLSVALQQPLLKEAFQYNDSTPTIAGGALQVATKKSALEFAEEALFQPMGFRRYEWMHQDASGMDLAGYGLRLRPIDMQKFGLLYLNHGNWRGKQLISKEWVERSFQPWNRSTPDKKAPDYGWFWWAYYYGPGWTAHVANGWKGQRIAVIPEQKIVITMTACIEDGSEHEFFNQLVTKVVMSSLQHGSKQPTHAGELADLLTEVHHGPSRFGDFIEYRMVPSSSPKQIRKPFTH
jgi:CubicO group peptidase (beta-lactamase class C family)